MFSEGIFPIGDGLLDVDEQLLKGLLVPHDINDIYDVEQTPFARGKFAAVRRAIHKNSGVHFAAKFLKRRRRAQSSDKEIKHEIAVLMLCDGAENIVKLNAVHESRSDTALLLELATGGELQTFLDNEECLSEAQARFCMREVLKGLQFLHKRSIAHLDLKPQNILLTGENIEDGLKLCDFGISRVVEEGSNVREIVGTPDYVAPEVLQYEPLSLLTDIWSVGVLTYVLLTGFSPFGGDTKQETFLNISQCALEFPDKLFDGVSSAAIDFMRRALRIKPSDRMSAAGCLEHIWLKDECDIGRQIYENISKVATNGDVEPSCSSNSDLDEDDDVDVDAEQQSDSQSDKMESSDVEVAQTTKITTNGSLKKKTQTTTAVHTVPATRATTIPLCTHIHQKHYQQQQQRQRGQQQQHMSSLLAGRRHSSDSNKENTFLATKKIQPITNVANVTTTATTNNKSTATIIIGAINTKANIVDGKNGTNISQMHNNNDDKQIIIDNHIKCNNVNNCLFPDAPTTPKVIRKAPNSDDSSPTSVKALVKKFQLEPTTNGTAITMPTVPASATSTTTTTTINGTTTTTTNGTTNGKCSTLILKQQKSPPQQQQQVVATTKSRKNSISPQKTVASPTKSTTMKTHVVNDQQNHRRSSEPQVTSATAKSPTRTTTTTITSPNSYKSTCVYCLTCGATSNSNSSNGVGVGVGENGNNSTTNGCRHSSVRSTPSPTSSGSKTSLIPLYHHRHHHHQHHHQHHHHHELVVAKNGASAGAASNLSLDQGIIC